MTSRKWENQDLPSRQSFPKAFLLIPATILSLHRVKFQHKILLMNTMGKGNNMQISTLFGQISLSYLGDKGGERVGVMWNYLKIFLTLFLTNVTGCLLNKDTPGMYTINNL